MLGILSIVIIAAVIGYMCTADDREKRGIEWQRRYREQQHDAWVKKNTIRIGE
jgi:hypothetical protein